MKGTFGWGPYLLLVPQVCARGRQCAHGGVEDGHRARGAPVKAPGRLEDVKAEEEERHLRALKETKREKHRSKSRKGSSGLLLD